VLCGAALMENYLNGFCPGKGELLLEVLVLDFKFITLNALRQLFVLSGAALTENYLEGFFVAKSNCS